MRIFFRILVPLLILFFVIFLFLIIKVEKDPNSAGTLIMEDQIVTGVVDRFGREFSILSDLDQVKITSSELISNVEQQDLVCLYGIYYKNPTQRFLTNVYFNERPVTCSQNGETAFFGDLAMLHHRLLCSDGELIFKNAGSRIYRPSNVIVYNPNTMKPFACYGKF